ncbi:hypothetical protein KBY58_03145 [Cyanobium sp. HWJ4-Hawea]|uniref:hypothetical protein n=1 Tax=Cyanobium sp. HWJ4-Hawea TaxID=2823713 RepID=UPI0020CCF700|nr:hypothetical protein [Cyanobium sp. HWJ4-Hawea]MCP9808428.1 hypothetical protein [Cyanobium sp. HWJ4-Hawea]
MAPLPDPMTPHAAPMFDTEGHLTYTGTDGLRYVVSLPPEAELESAECWMANLRQGDGLFRHIEELCGQWLASVSGGELDRSAALALLLTTLEVALDPDSPPTDSACAD